MHRAFLVMFVFAFLLLPSVLATEIGYVVRTPFPLNDDEIAIKNVLENEGHSVEILDDNSVIIPGLYDVIIVGNDVTNAVNIFDNKEHKTLFLSYTAAENAGFSKYSGKTSGTSLIIDSEHFITESIGRGTKTVYKNSGNINYLYGCKAKNSESLAYKSENWKSSLLILDKDSLLLKDGSCSKINVPINERNLFFGLPDASKWGPNTQILFIKSIEWLIHGSDEDGDGFFYDEDCNDKDASINPNAEEIPYNGIDEDCDGYDLADVDKDGYCKQSYEIKDKILQCPKETGNIGTDCNDNDTSINPGSSDVYKNCKNDFPIISPISKITVHETEVVRIEVNAIDPEGDSLAYSIDSSKFSQQDNVFTWQTNYNDYGNYIFTITVSDGSLSSEKKVEIEIKNTNQAPVCSEIPALVWNEDETAILNLGDYCHDLDGDSIGFYLNDTSEDTHIKLNSLEEGKAEFSSEKNWNGEDWIVFKASDEKDYTLTNSIKLKVLPVNDEPVLEKNIEEIITWKEDTNLLNYINLNDYFSDVDGDNLEYDVVGNHFINVTIDSQGVVSFYPEKDWAEEEAVFFIAKDSEFSVNSNVITLKVLDVNEPPEFQEMNCNATILEDVKETCELKASDFENDTFTFSVVSKNNLDCSIQGSNLEYVSKKDYNGKASCLLRVADKYGYSEYLLEVEVEAVNDSPVIRDYFPKGSVKIMENTSKEFSIDAYDVDSEIEISWFLDDVNLNITGNKYLFAQGKGNYEVKAKVNDDEEEVSQIWNVFVGEISDFTCKEAEGYLCSENEMCREANLLGVKDTDVCCAVACLPKFSRAERCESINEKIKIEIEKPDKEEEFEIGDTIKVKLKINNDVEEDIRMSVRTYLYDTTKDRIIEDDKKSVKIDKDDSETVEFEIKIPEDIDEERNYAIFVEASDKNEYCNENYVKIDISREENVVIKEIKIPSNATSGENIDAEVKVKNIGGEDEDVYITVENSELDISERSRALELERYGDDDEATEYFTIEIPQGAKEGDYEIKVNVFFNSKENSLSKKLAIESKIETELGEIEKISLEGENIEAIDKQTESRAKVKSKMIVLLLLSMFFVLVAVVLLFYLIYRRNY